MENEKPPAQELPVNVGARDRIDLLFSPVASNPPTRIQRHALFLAELVLTLPVLILGIIVGLVGLLVWYLSFYLNEEGAPTDPWGRFWQFFPRVTILLFIELLAGFFLRQYRIGVEDLKYFLERARKADMNTTAYSIFEAVNDVDGKKDFAKAMVAGRRKLGWRKTKQLRSSRP